ncbi:MAG: iron-sulfur cluster repair di-iron protein [Ignavibacteriaceae bacterium]|nr:iron-sulfur cluster repair di-iron protein [Ignavibacteriaceae bacterium]
MYASEDNKQTLSEIVKNNYKAAAVFERYNLDFCCKGNKVLSTACEEKGVNESEVLSELSKIEAYQNSSINYEEWGLDFLIDYIVNTHHNYVRKIIPVISEHVNKVASVHGQNHPELLEIARHYTTVYKDLKQHMMKEEEILFPHIKYLVKSKGTGSKIESPYFGSVQNPIKMMEAEHINAGDELFEIRRLSNNYTIPADACNTFRVTFLELKEFEEDLHRHVHLENSILFPKSIILEAELNNEPVVI